MATRRNWRTAQARALDGIHARLAARSRLAPPLLLQPEPRSIGFYARGRQLMAGKLMFAGHLLEAEGEALPWDMAAPDAVFTEELQACAWLDDLAAVGDIRARRLAQRWVWGWIARYGRGTGPGWAPGLTGRRLIRWIHHALFLLRGKPAEEAQVFYRALAAQARFLAARGRRAEPGLPRMEALTGLLYAGLALEGMQAHVAPASAALAAECRARIDAQGGIASRNPEELLDIFTLLTWAEGALAEAHREIDPAIPEAIARIAPCLRALRHADGGLARFHGGGRGPEGRLDQALAASGSKKRRAEGLAMGFARLSAARTSVITDAAPPPSGAAAAQAHASTLAFELTSGRRPVVVNCGSGEGFGAEWRRAGRATPSHSTLCLEGYSSGRLAAERWIGGARRELLEAAPQHVPVQVTHLPEGQRFEGGHDGYVAGHGLTHARSLILSHDGRSLKGEDYLVALDAPAKARFDRALDQARPGGGLRFEIRFHIHPEAEVSLADGGDSAAIALRSGENWIFRPEGRVEMTLQPSVYLEKGRLRPRATQQVVLSGRAMQYATRVRWSLAKAQDTAFAVRDLERDEAADSD